MLGGVMNAKLIPCSKTSYGLIYKHVFSVYIYYKFLP